MFHQMSPRSKRRVVIELSYQQTIQVTLVAKQKTNDGMLIVKTHLSSYDLSMETYSSHEGDSHSSGQITGSRNSSRTFYGVFSFAVCSSALQLGVCKCYTGNVILRIAYLRSHIRSHSTLSKQHFPGHHMSVQWT